MPNSTITFTWIISFKFWVPFDLDTITEPYFAGQETIDKKLQVPKITKAIRSGIRIYTQFSQPAKCTIFLYMLHCTSIQGIAISFLWCYGFSSAKFRDDREC